MIPSLSKHLFSSMFISCSCEAVPHAYFFPPKTFLFTLWKCFPPRAIPPFATYLHVSRVLWYMCTYPASYGIPLFATSFTFAYTDERYISLCVPIERYTYLCYM